MRVHLRRFLCLALCLLLPLTGLAASEDESPQVRVLLKRLGLTNRADLILDGKYTIRCGGVELALTAGSSVTVEALEDSLYLFWNGGVLQNGESVTFIRHADSRDVNGLRFSRGGNLYPGDLTVTNEQGGVRCVLTIGVEDYLQGVVPYEMSDSFPPEALKAQAVCARTYVLSRMNPNRDYDVVDTTQDQVFNGVSGVNTASAEAVGETRGVVGMYRGRLAACYYSASNGGQTELAKNVWSGHGPGPEEIRDDPYDLENPASPVKRAVLRADADGLPQAFREILYNFLYDEMLRLGYDTEPTSLRVTGISGPELKTPAHGGENRCYTELKLTVSWSAKRWRLPAASETEEAELSISDTRAPTAEPAETPVHPAPTAYLTDFAGEEETEVILPLFPQTVRALNLSICGGDNELITLIGTKEGWILESRRYGHGVGMSQRGAEWMARRYGFTYQEILAFYYPGMTLDTVGLRDRKLPVMPAVFDSTPAPAASSTPAPRPTLIPVGTAELPEGAFAASVENVADDSSLNLRTEPNTACEIITRLYKHQQVIVLETLEDGIWAHVRVGSLEGYVMIEFLDRKD